MNRSIKRSLLSLALIFSAGISFAQTHPFLIVKETDYPALRARAANAPWSGMKADAISAINTLTYDPSASVSAKAIRMNDIVAAGALAYILDPANKAGYKTKLVDAMENWPGIYAELSPTAHSAAVWPSGAFFNSVIALDIIYNDLTGAERSSLETKLGQVGTWFTNNPTNWPECGYGASCLWAIYTGNQSLIDSKKALYKSKLLSRITGRGVYIDGAGYGNDRCLGQREAKTYIMDVLEYTGKDNTFYNNAKIKSLYEWFPVGGTNPMGRMISFSDCPPIDNVDGNRLWSLHKFSSQAAKNASWLANRLGLDRPGGHIIPYVLTDQLLPAPEKPTSSMFTPSGMATFWEDSSSNLSLQGALWNHTEAYAYSHAHKEVNAIVINGYGELLLRNAGYEGYGYGFEGFSWDYIHNSAVSGNTVMVNGANHTADNGGGIVEGFTSDLFDYARGDSGAAVGGGKHFRNFCFVHPQDGRNGYFLLFDEVDAASGNTANMALHPNSANCTTTSNNIEYSWSVNKYSGAARNLTIFLGTPPQSVEIRDGALCNDDSYPQVSPDSFIGKYLYGSYAADSSGNKNFVTVLFPHDATHAKATMARVSGTGYTGAAIDVGNATVDTALESFGTAGFTHSGIAMRGKAVWYRENAQGCPAFFVGKGRQFDYTTGARYGFESNVDVTVHLRDKTGSIQAGAAAEVTFYYPAITTVLIDGSVAEKISSGSGWVKAAVPQGCFALGLGTGSGPSDTTPPFAPGTVRDGTGTTDSGSTLLTTQLSANWTAANDAESGISGYRYAIGTTAGGTQTVDWTNLGNVLAVTRTGLTLTVGATYYFSVKAVNGEGLASTAANSNGQYVQGTTVATVFSTQVYFGDSANYTPKTALRWQVSTEGSDARYFLNTSAFNNDGDKLGEYSIINDRTYADFTMTLKAKTAENIGTNAFSDYAVVFGFQDADNYYYLMANATASASQLFVVQNGVRTALGTSATALIPDTNWHEIEVKRTGASVTVKLDGAVKIGPVNNSVYPGGQAGIGSYNDSVYFDDIKIEVGQQDTTAPLPPSTVRDGTATDISSTASMTQLSANWPAGSDPESSISGYQYAIGSSPAGTDVANWMSIGNVLSLTRSGLSLVIGTTYYFGIKAVNEAGLISAAVYSNGQVVISTSAPDTTAPVGPSTVYDGSTVGVDAQKTVSQTTLSANWPAAADAQSGISGYRYAIGTTAGNTNVTNGWISNGTNLAVTKTGLALSAGATYYFSVKAVNGQGLDGAVANSNGQYVENNPDTTPPYSVAEVRDGTGSEDVDIIVTTSAVDSITELSANWDASTDAESAIERYWYVIGTTAGGSDIVGWTTKGTLTAVTHTGLTLLEGVEYYFSVKAQNGAGLESGISVSDGLYISRQSGGNLEITGVQSSAGANSATISWNTNNPATSQAEYGTTQAYGSMTIEDSSLVTAHSVVITGLLPATQYHFRVISEDAGGNSAVSADNVFTAGSAGGASAGINAYPNPYDLSRPGGIKFRVGATGGEVKIYTLTGKLVRQLSVRPGISDVAWDGRNESGERVARGIYLYTITGVNGDKVTGKIAVK